jgi:uncharacterized protein YjiS (DUF1127 family)
MSSIVVRGAAPRIASPAREYRPTLLARFVAYMAAEIRVRRDLRALNALDDAALHDIGLVRGETEYAVREGRARIPEIMELGRTPAEGRPFGILPSNDAEWR